MKYEILYRNCYFFKFKIERLLCKGVIIYYVWCQPMNLVSTIVCIYYADQILSFHYCTVVIFGGKFSELGSNVIACNENT